MAIIFESPKKIQKKFLRIIIILLVFVLLIVPFIIFSPGLINRVQNVSQEEISEPDIKINFNTIDSDQVKNLDPFGAIELEFFYIVEDKNGRQIIGRISAAAKNDAQKILEEGGFKVSELVETNIGRKEPFAPY